MALERRTALIPAGNSNRPGLAMEPVWITVHETGNPAPTAGAEMHRQFTHDGGGRFGVSFHEVVDAIEAIKLLPYGEVAWHAGDGYFGAGNRGSVAVEVCINKDWPATLANAVELVAQIAEELEQGAERIVQHNHWSGKNCPAQLRRSGWEAFFAAVKSRLKFGPGEPSLPERDHIRLDVPGVGERWIIKNIYRRWADVEDSLYLYGYPLTGQQGSRQIFERVGMHIAAGDWPEMHDVYLMRLGVMVARERYGERYSNRAGPFAPVAEAAGQSPERYLYCPETQHAIQMGFYQTWRETGGIDRHGFPVSEEFVEDGKTVQYFERSRMEHHPGEHPERHDVLLGRLGAEALEAGLLDWEG